MIWFASMIAVGVIWWVLQDVRVNFPLFCWALTLATAFIMVLWAGMEGQ